MLVGLFFGMGVILFFWLVVGLGGLLFGLAGASRRLGWLDREIKPAEVVVWSWVSIRRSVVKSLLYGLFAGLLGGLLLGLFFGLATWLFVGLLFRQAIALSELVGLLPEALVIGLVIGLFFGVFFGLLTGLAGGLSRETLDEHNFVRPNQGIWDSARNSMLSGLLFGTLFGTLFGVVGGLLFGVVGGLLSGLVGGLLYGLGSGLLYGLVVALLSGGVPCIQHIVLRLLLWRSGALPWHYVRFLEEATDHILLQRVGGGYRFIHPLLLDYFAALGTAVSPGPVQQSFPERQ